MDDNHGDWFHAVRGLPEHPVEPLELGGAGMESVGAWTLRMLRPAVETEDLPRSEINEATAAALQDLETLLADGEWHGDAEIREIARRHSVRFVGMLTAATEHTALAESDSSSWFAIPDDRTPDLAPDEEIAEVAV